MAGQKLAQYTVGVDFQVDTKGLQNAMAAVRQQMDIKKFQNLHLDLDIKDAQARYSEIMKTEKIVRQALDKSYNLKLNTYDFNKFTAALNDISFNKVQKDFTDLGATGQRALLEMTKAFTTTNIQLTQTHTLLEKMGTTLANTLRWQAATKAIQSVTGSIQQAYYFTKDLDKSLNDIRIVTDKSAVSMEKFTAQAISAAKALGKSTTDYTNASLLYYQQGLSDEEVARRTETTLKAANVTGQAASAVSEELTAVWNGFQVELDKTEETVDKLAAVAAHSASNLEEISTAMSKVASAANMTGVNIDQLTAQIATIVSVTRQAPETVGTALKTIYARMSDLKLGETDEEGVSLGDVSSTLHSLGVEVLDTTGNLRDMGTVIEEIAVKWDTLNTAQQTALAQSLGGKRQYTNLVALFDNWSMYNQNLKISENSLGTLQRQQDTYMESTKAHLQELATAKEELYASIMDADTINKSAYALRSMVESVTKIVKTLGGGKGVFNTISGILMMAMKAPLGKAISTSMNNALIKANNQQAIDYVLKSSDSLKQYFSQTYAKNDQSNIIAAQYNEDINKYTKQYTDNAGMTVEQYTALRDAAFQYAEAKIKLAEVDELNIEAQNKYQQALNEELKFENRGELDASKSKLVKKLEQETQLLEKAKFALEQYKSAQETRDTISLSNERQIRDAKIRQSGLKDVTYDALVGNTIQEKLQYAQGQQLAANTKATATGWENIAKALQVYIDKLESLKQAHATTTQDINKLQNAVDKHTKEVNKLTDAEEALKNATSAASAAEEVETRKFNQMRLEREALTSATGQAISGLITGIGSFAMGVSQLSNIFQQMQKGEADFASLTSSLAMTLPMIAKGYKSITNNVAILGNRYLTATRNLIASQGVMQGLTTASSKFLSILISIGKRFAIIIAIIATMNTINNLITKQQNIRKKQLELLEEEAKATRKLAEETAEEQKKVVELSQAYQKLQKELVDNNTSKEEELQATYNLLQQYGYENEAIDLLTGKYQNYADAISAVTQAKINEASTAADDDIAKQQKLVESQIIQANLQNVYRGLSPVSQAEDQIQQQLFEEAFNIDLDNINAISELLLNENTRAKVQRWVKAQVEAGAASSEDIFVGALSNLLTNTQSNYDIIQSNQDTKKEGQKTIRFNQSGRALLSGTTQEKVAEYQQLLNEGYTQEEVKELATNYDDLNSYYKTFLIKNEQLFKQYGNDIYGFSLQESAALYDLITNYKTFEGDTLDAIKNIKLAYADYLTELNKVGAAQQAILSFDTSKGYHSKEDFKNIFDTEQLEQFSKYLDSIGYDIETFYNHFDEEMQSKVLNNFYFSSITDANHAIDFTNLVNKQVEEERTRLLEEREKIQHLRDTEFDKQINDEINKISSFFANITDPMWEAAIAEQIGIAQENFSQFRDAGTDKINYVLDDDNSNYLTEDEEKYKKYISNKINNVLLNSQQLNDYDEQLINLNNAITALQESQRTGEHVAKAYNTIIEASTHDFKLASSAVDELQSTYNTLADAVDTYNENGYITLDQMQQLVAMDADQLQYLTLENNEMGVQTDAINDLLHAKVGMMRQQIINTTYTQLEALKTDNLKDVVMSASYANLAMAASEGTLTDAMKETVYTVHALVEEIGAQDAEKKAYAEWLEQDMQKRLNLIDKYVNMDVSSSRSKAEDEILKDVEAELDIYHDINIELEKINKATERLKKTRDQLVGQDLLDSYAQEITLLNSENDALERKLALQQQDAADKRAELGAHGVAFDVNGQVANYNTILARWANQVNAVTDKEQREAMEEQRQKLIDTLKDYEDLWNNEIEEVQDKLTDNSAAIIQAQVDRMNIVVDTTIDLKDLKRKFNEFKRDYIDKLLPTEFAKAIDTINNNMSATYQAMGMSYDYVTKALAEVQKMQQGFESDLYGNNINLALEDLRSNSEKLQAAMQEVTGDLVAATEKYRESIDELSNAFDRQTEYLEKLAGAYDKQTKAYQLLYGENGAASVAAQNLETISDIYNKQADKYAQQASYWQSKISEWETTLSDPAITTELAQALTEQIKDAQDKMIDANEKAGEAYVNAVEKANEGFAQRIAAENNQLAEGILGQSLDKFKTDWEATKELSDMYYDNVNRAYQTSLLMGKYQKSINENTGAAQQKLQNAYDKELATLKEKDKLTKYDLERAEKRYQLVLAQIALEEAQQNKNTLKLARDSQGNYTYQYVADSNAINEAQDKVNSLANDIYNLDKDNWRANTDAIIADLERLSQKAAEVFRIFGADSDEGNEVVAKYYEKLNELANQRVTIAGNSEESMVSELKRIADSDDVAQLIGNKEYNLEKEKYTDLANTNLLKMEEALVNALSNERNRLNQDLILQNAQLTDDVAQNLDKNFIKWSQTNENINQDTHELMVRINGELISLQDATDNVLTAIENRNLQVLGVIQDNSKLAVAAYDEMVKEIAEELIPAHEKYVDELQQEVEFTEYALDACDKLARKFDNLYNSSGKVIEQVTGIYDALKKFDEIPNTITKTIVTDYQVRNEDKAGGLNAGTSGGQGTASTNSSTGWVKEEDINYVVHSVHRSPTGISDLAPQITSKHGEPLTYKLVNPSGGYPIYVKSGSQEGYISFNTFNLLAKLYSNLDTSTVPVSYKENANNGRNGMPTNAYQADVTYMDGTVKTMNYNQAVALMKNKKQEWTFDTGGYTGQWANGSKEGRMAMLHQKEIVLNATDTANLLDMVKYQREMLMIERDAALNKVSAVNESLKSNGGIINPVYNITASFPNAVDHKEIELAILDLPNFAAQRANSNLM